MNIPFFTNRRWYQQADPTLRSFHPSVQRPPERNSAPKVVRIPVQFLRSEQLDRTASAVRIQKVLRGFLARKSLRKIKDIKLQVDEIEERLKRGEVVELVKKDAKERLRMSESLMALLLKLDSICGADFGVRGCRKAVIRKAIALQERLDAIAAVDLDKEDEARVSSEAEDSVPPANLKNSCEDEGNWRDDRDEDEDEDVNLKNSCEDEGNWGDDRDRDRDRDEDEEGIVDVGVDCEVKVSDFDEGKEKERELLEKMMKENEAMMGMMRQLFERSETQTRMLNALTNRVELMEKAFVCDRLRRKKKKKMNKKATPSPCTQN